MASEILRVPEQHLEEFIQIVRVGLKYFKTEEAAAVSDEVRDALERWCNEGEEYLKR